MLYFIFTLLITYFLYYIFIIRKYDKNGKLKVKKVSKLKSKFVSWIGISLTNKNEEKMPAEVEIFVKKFKVDLTKVNYKNLLNAIGIICSLDIAIIVTIITIIPVTNIYIQLGIGFVLIIPIVLISYFILGKIYKRKGYIKNENVKRNRK